MGLNMHDKAALSGDGPAQSMELTKRGPIAPLPTPANGMVPFIGTKTLRAKPMKRIDYIQLRRWQLPANENPDDDGYLVEYLDGSGGNVEGFEGYISWSPADVFEAAYDPINGALSFSHAIELLKQGLRVRRAGWNGKGMWIALQPGSEITREQARGGAALARAQEGADEITILPHLDMRAADGSIVVGWLASQTDMLANDWQVVD